MTTSAIPPQHPPWGTQVPLTWVTEGDPEYAALVTELRGFLDDVASARPAPEDSAALAQTLREWRSTLRQTATGEHGQVFGRRSDLPRRGSTMLPDYVVHDVGDETIEADVRFGRYYLGGGEAVHGGVISTARRCVLMPRPCSSRSTYAVCCPEPRVCRVAGDRSAGLPGAEQVDDLAEDRQLMSGDGLAPHVFGGEDQGAVAEVER